MITLTIGSDGSGSYEDENGVESLTASSQEQLRSLLLGRAAARARQEGQPLRVAAKDTSGLTHLLITPSGAISLAKAEEPTPEPTSQSTPVNQMPTVPAPATPAQPVAAPASAPQPMPAPTQVNQPAQAMAAAAPQQPMPQGVPLYQPAPAQQAPQVMPDQVNQPTFQGVPANYAPQQALAPQNAPSFQMGTAPAPVSRPRPDSFLSQSSAGGPKPTGWRAVAGRLGLKVQASQAQCQQWEDERTVSQHWPGPRTIAVLNGKGGAGKTPTSILLASNFARLGSGSVVAADGNVTRGTLGWRTEQGPHNATILDMVPQTEVLMDPSARNGDVAAYTHHQTIDQFDVLRSNPLLLSTEQKLTPEELDGIQQVLTRYYRMIIWDTGNDEGDSLWLRIVSHADQIVIATTTRTDHAEAGRLLLQGLSGRDERSAALAANAVVVISQADREEPPATSLVDGFAGIAREVVTIPYDRAMREQWLRSDKLAPATRAAWLHAAAAVARGL
jgi:hypothetical protein